MKLLDTNVLVHAANRSSPLQPLAARLLERGLATRGRYCIAPQNLVEFSAVVSRPRFIQLPLPHADLVRMTRLLYRSRSLMKIYPKRATVMRTIDEGAALGLTGPRWYDLFLAVTMREAGVQTIVTEDFAHFSGFAFLKVLHIQEASEQEPDE